MNLYWKWVPAGKSSFTRHTGFEEVYPLADSATALEVSQSPSWSIEPEMKIFSPYEVATRSFKNNWNRRGGSAGASRGRRHCRGGQARGGRTAA